MAEINHMPLPQTFKKYRSGHSRRVCVDKNVLRRCSEFMENNIAGLIRVQEANTPAVGFNVSYSGFQ